MNKRTLRGATVVVTGATSGIGRATALTFARHGARLVLAARRAEVLRDVAAECERQGAQAALPVPTDMTDADAVRRLAQAAADFGGDIDVWVNNAGSGAVGPFEKVPLAAHEQVLRLNLLGYLYGAYHALPHFKRQPAGGTLINVVSLGSWLPEPYTASYSASKYGLRGLFDTLRMELTDAPNIHVCDVHPAYIDTPGFQHGANYTGRVIKPASPVFPAQKVADAIVALALNPRPNTMVGWTAPVMRWAYALAPGATNWAFMKFMRGYLAQADPAPVSENSLFEPRPAPHGTGISGGWRRPSSSAGSSTWLLGAALAAGAAGLYAWQKRNGEVVK